MDPVSPSSNGPELFFSYSHKDEALREKLASHLTVLERQGVIRAWHDRNIDAGSEWKRKIDAHLQSASIILLLISADFLASDYCFGVEMKAAMDRHETGSAVVIPVILRPVNWEGSPFAKLQAVPKNAKPITTYANRNVGFEEIAVAIRNVAERLTQNSAPTALAAAGVPVPLRTVLPVTPDSPLLLGFAIDVSGSMQESISNPKGPGLNRLQAVLASIKELAGANEVSGPASAAMNLVKVFAYGFGFTDRATEYGSLASLARQFLGNAIPEIPSHVYRGSTRDLFEIAGLGTDAPLLNTLRTRWKDLEEGLWQQRIDLFGDTPMHSAMKAIQARLSREWTKYQGEPRSVLIIISDGDTTDGSPLNVCQALQQAGVTIVGVYLTSADVTEPRKLYAEVGSGWPNGAKALFGCSSAIGEGAGSLYTVALANFQGKGWQVTSNSHLFLQLNQSEVLSEFVTAILDAHTSGSAAAANL